MSVQLNHTIIKSREQRATADFIAEILGIEPPAGFANDHFLMIQLSNDVSLDVMQFDGAYDPQHYAFLVSEEEFDQVLTRLQRMGVEYFAGPWRSRPGQINTLDGGRGVYFPSPGGHDLEVLTRPYGADAEATALRHMGN